MTFFNIYLIGKGLKKLRRCLCAFELLDHLRMTFCREITPLGLLARLNIMNHLVQLLNKAHLKAEHLHRLSLHYPARNLGVVSGMEYRSTFNGHRFVRKYSVTLVLPISDFISTFVGGYCLFS